MFSSVNVCEGRREREGEKELDVWKERENFTARISENDFFFFIKNNLNGVIIDSRETDI